MKPRKELEAKVNRLLEGGQKLSKDIIEIGQRLASTSKILQDMVGVIELLQQKGLVTDEEIATAISDARKKYIEQKRIQSELTRAIEDGRGYVGQQLLRKTGADINRGSKDNPFGE